jgi:nicotinamide mononucleotide transporter
MFTLLAQWVAPLNHVLFDFGADAVSWAELLGFVTGAVCVVLTVRRHIANFPTGIANSAFFLVLFLSTRLWADAGLQVVYIVLSFIGWRQWLHGGELHAKLEVGRASPGKIVWLLGFVAIGTVGLTALLRQANDIAPFWDALTTSLSLAAQWLLNAKKLESWLFWIAADCIYIPLYVVKHLDLTAIVYVAFLAMSVTGLISWRRALRDATADPSREFVASAVGVA